MSDLRVAKPGSTGTPPSPPELTPRGLFPVLVGLWALAVSQPLLDMTARQPQFLVAHGLGPMEVVLLALFLVVVPGTVLGGSAVAARLGGGAAGAVLALPAVLVLLHIGGRLGLVGLPLLAGATLAGGVVGFWGVRGRSLRDLGPYLAFMPALVVGYHFLVLPQAVLAGEERYPSVAIERVANPVPVVVVILDELPIASLIDAEGELLDDQFPAFARLAGDGVWYRNAITVETRTTESIPAILSGRLVSDGLVPNVANHPRSLMTLLSASHDVAAVEPVTELCPAWVCGDDSGVGRVGRWSLLASDLAVLYGHLVVPAPWSDRLPTIDQNWTGFTASEEGSWDLVEAVGEAVEGDRRRDVSDFLASLQATQRPLLRVAHLVLPHRPWEFLPDGTRHGQENPDGYGQRG